MFGLVRKGDFLSKVSVLLGSNGVDFPAIVAKTRELGVKKAEEALLLQQEAENSRSLALAKYVEAKAEAQAVYQKAMASAKSNLDDQIQQVDWQTENAQAARSEANKLLDAATYFS